MAKLDELAQVYRDTVVATRAASAAVEEAKESLERKKDELGAARAAMARAFDDLIVEIEPPATAPAVPPAPDAPATSPATGPVVVATEENR